MNRKGGGGGKGGVGREEEGRAGVGREEEGKGGVGREGMEWVGRTGERE